MSKADWIASWLGEMSKLGKVTAKKMFRGDAEKEGLLVIPIMRRPLTPVKLHSVLPPLTLGDH